MSITIISYSMTGNNNTLASKIANALSTEHVKITEPKKRGYGTITFDLLFRRTPRVFPGPETLSQYDEVIFVAPVWMGQPAFPLRAYLKFLKAHPHKYGFVTISGGSLNPNPKLRDNITRLAGNAPSVFVAMYIADLMPKELEINPKSVESYHLTDKDMESLTKTAVNEINKCFGTKAQRV
ncbi:MAG: hypothetical protein VB120_05975 [Lachnospiraceae bacterium]|nr:hypothetical protein [Lachnospiraceae bacterium]